MRDLVTAGVLCFGHSFVVCGVPTANVGSTARRLFFKLVDSGPSFAASCLLAKRTSWIRNGARVSLACSRVVYRRPKADAIQTICHFGCCCVPIELCCSSCSVVRERICSLDGWIGIGILFKVVVARSSCCGSFTANGRSQASRRFERFTCSVRSGLLFFFP